MPKSILGSWLVKDGLVGGWLDDVPPHLDGQAIIELLVFADRIKGPGVTEGVANVFSVHYSPTSWMHSRKGGVGHQPTLVEQR
jgi:hypothetical protein